MSWLKTVRSLAELNVNWASKVSHCSYWISNREVPHIPTDWSDICDALSPDKPPEERGIWMRSYIRMHTHVRTSTMEKHPRKGMRCWKCCTHTYMKAHTHTPTHTVRSYSTSQGQWHTSAWIITLSHSSSRLRITSYRRPLGKGWGEVGRWGDGV